MKASKEITDLFGEVGSPDLCRIIARKVNRAESTIRHILAGRQETTNRMLTRIEVLLRNEQKRLNQKNQENEQE